MNPSDMRKGHYYWRGQDLYLCTAWISKEENGYGNAKLKRVSGKPQVSGAWYCFKYWTDNSFREYNP